MPNRMKLPEALNLVRQQGRYGDTELAHVTPREAAMLRAMGGSGTINPKTGLREYAFDPGTGLGTDPGGPEGAIGAGMDTSGMGGGGGEGPVQGPTFSGEPLAQTGFGRAVQSLNDYMQNPANFQGGPSILSPSSFAAYGLAQALGSGLRGMGIVGSAPEVAFDYPTGPEGRSESAMQAMAGGPAAPSYMRGGTMTPPSEISSFIGPGMSDLQQRALIGTYGTQGLNPAFRTDPVRRYYANILSRELVQPGGQLAQTPYILPIEQQYLSGVVGRPVQDYSNAAQVYEAIRGLM